MKKFIEWHFFVIPFNFNWIQYFSPQTIFQIFFFFGSKSKFVFHQILYFLYFKFGTSYIHILSFHNLCVNFFVDKFQSLSTKGFVLIEFLSLSLRHSNTIHYPTESNLDLSFAGNQNHNWSNKNGHLNHKSVYPLESQHTLDISSHCQNVLPSKWIQWWRKVRASFSIVFNVQMFKSNCLKRFEFVGCEVYMWNQHLFKHNSRIRIYVYSDVRECHSMNSLS